MSAELWQRLHGISCNVGVRNESPDTESVQETVVAEVRNGSPASAAQPIAISDATAVVFAIAWVVAAALPAVSPRLMVLDMQARLSRLGAVWCGHGYSYGCPCGSAGRTYIRLHDFYAAILMRGLPCEWYSRMPSNRSSIGVCQLLRRSS